MKRNPFGQIAKLLVAAILSTVVAISITAQTNVVSVGVLNGKAVNLVRPIYPASARRSNASGTVNVQVTIDETGKVVSAAAVSGHPLLRSSAVSAARASTFKPTYVSGKAVKVSGIIIYNIPAPGSTVAQTVNTNEKQETRTNSAETEEETEKSTEQTSEDVQDAEETAEYKVGDAVEVSYAGQWNPGKIVEITGSGESIRATVDYTFQGEARNAKFFYNGLRRATVKAASPVKSNKSTLSGSGSLDYGDYVCTEGLQATGLAQKGYFRLNPNGTYRYLDGGSTGRYKYNAETGEITWLSGYFTQGGRSTTIYKPGNRVSQIDITFHTQSGKLYLSCGHNK